jgi:hypothetical protein
MSNVAISARRGNNNSQLPLYASLTGDDTCTAAGITARSHAPALALCRQLLAAGLDPDQALEVYRGATLALRIRSIGEGAQLTVKEDNRGTPRFVAYRSGPDERAGAACGDASPVRQSVVAAP